MTRIELTEKETDLLIEVLGSSLSELKAERVRTDRRDFHAGLVEREHFVADLIKRLESGV